MAKTIKIEVDHECESIALIDEDGASRVLPLYSEEAFREISRLWVSIGWVLKYSYTFTWLGQPLLQLPEDVLRIQEVVYRIKPDVIVETGVAHGGSLIFYASLCKAMGKGQVIGVDIEIRPKNRRAIESHFLFPYITLIEGNSIDPQVVSKVHEQIKPRERVLVLLDSCHTKSHVLGELEAYSPMVSEGSYIVAMDGIMEQLVGAPRSQPDWAWNNPLQAALEFVAKHPEFEIHEPHFLFNEGSTVERITYWPKAFIRKR